MYLLEYFKPLSLDESVPGVQFLVVKEYNQGGKIPEMTLALEFTELEQSMFNISEDELENKIIETLESFPKVKVENVYDVQRAKTNIARVTRRGVGNSRYKNIYWYRGRGHLNIEHETPRMRYLDSPFVVVERAGMYAIVKRPGFENFGFVASDLYTETDNTLTFILE